MQRDFRHLYYFNPRSRGGSDSKATHSGHTEQISIHAPAGGATKLITPLSRSSSFQSTLPRGERQQKLTKYFSKIQILISILLNISHLHHKNILGMIQITNYLYTISGANLLEILCMLIYRTVHVTKSVHHRPQYHVPRRYFLFWFYTCSPNNKI